MPLCLCMLLNKRLLFDRYATNYMDVRVFSLLISQIQMTQCDKSTTTVKHQACSCFAMLPFVSFFAFGVAGMRMHKSSRLYHTGFLWKCLQFKSVLLCLGVCRGVPSLIPRIIQSPMETYDLIQCVFFSLIEFNLHFDSIAIFVVRVRILSNICFSWIGSLQLKCIDMWFFYGQFCFIQFIIQSFNHAKLLLTTFPEWNLSTKSTRLKNNPIICGTFISKLCNRNSTEIEQSINLVFSFFCVMNLLTTKQIFFV